MRISKALGARVTILLAPPTLISLAGSGMIGCLLVEIGPLPALLAAALRASFPVIRATNLYVHQ